ncbi:MAG: hypothetical protein AAGG38_11060 [Planctomycetota bacterium]
MAAPVEITPADFEAEDPGLALRRHTDRCFFTVEEVVPGPERTGRPSVRGYVVDGHLIDPDDVAELRRTGAGGGALPSCTA